MANLDDLIQKDQKAATQGRDEKGRFISSKSIEDAKNRLSAYAYQSKAVNDAIARMTESLNKVAASFQNSSKHTEQATKHASALHSTYLKLSVAAVAAGYAASRAFSGMLASQKPLLAVSVSYADSLDKIKRGLQGISNVPMARAAEMLEKFQGIGPIELFRFGRDQASISALLKLQSSLAKSVGSEQAGTMTNDVMKSFGTDSRAMSRFLSDVTSSGVKMALLQNAGATGQDNLIAVSRALNALEIAQKPALQGVIKTQQIEEQLANQLERLQNTILEKLSPLLSSIADKWLPSLTETLGKWDLGKLWDTHKWEIVGGALGIGFLRYAAPALVRGAVPAAMAGGRLAAGAAGAGAALLPTAAAVAGGLALGNAIGNTKDEVKRWGGYSVFSPSDLWGSMKGGWGYGKDFWKNELGMDMSGSNRVQGAKGDAGMRERYLAAVAATKQHAKALTDLGEAAQATTQQLAPLNAQLQTLQNKVVAREEGKLGLSLAEARTNLLEAQQRRASALFGGSGWDANYIGRVNDAIQKQIDLLAEEKSLVIGTGLEAQKERLEIENKITDAQTKQLSNLANIARGWLDAVAQQATSAGRFSKIILTQESNLAAGLAGGMMRQAPEWLGSLGKPNTITPFRFSGSMSADLAGLAQHQQQLRQLYVSPNRLDVARAQAVSVPHATGADKLRVAGQLLLDYAKEASLAEQEAYSPRDRSPMIGQR